MKKPTYHLCTLVFGIVLLAFVMWLNFVPHCFLDDNSHPPFQELQICEYGWPFTMLALVGEGSKSYSVWESGTFLVDAIICVGIWTTAVALWELSVRALAQTRKIG